MGTWGTGISSNDTFEDIKYEFFELYNDGLEPTEITDRLINSNKDLIESEEDANNFWFAIALCQWECKSLTPELLERTTDIIKSGADIELWEELGAEKTELTKRQKALDKFLEKLNSEKKGAKKRKKKLLKDAIFRKGDCLTFELINGNWGGAYVLDADLQTELGLNYIALTDINSPSIPTEKDFKKSKILKFQIDSFKLEGSKAIPIVEESDEIGFYYEQQYKRIDFEIKVIGNINPNRKFDRNKVTKGGNWSWWPETFDQEKNKVNKPGITKLKKFLKTKWL